MHSVDDILCNYVLPVKATITLYPLGRPVRATVTLYRRPVRATITLSHIGRPFIITLFSNYIGEMMIHCNRLKDHVISSINGCSTQLHTPLSSNTPFGSYNYLAINSPSEKTKLMELLSQVEHSKDNIGNKIIV